MTQTLTLNNNLICDGNSKHISINNFEIIAPLIKSNWQPQSLYNVPLCDTREFRGTITSTLLDDIYTLKTKLLEQSETTKSINKEYRV